MSALDFFITNTPNHGTKYDGNDYYINTQRRKIDEMIKEMAEESISLFCLKITGKIDKMFQIFKDIYEEKKPNNTLFQFIDNIEVLSFSDEIIICIKNLS